MCIRDRDYYQSMLGLACFCMIIKGLKFTKNVPIMCTIGNTFSHALVPLGLLFFSVFLLLLGFAVVFQIKLCVSQMDGFHSLGASLFSVFQGLLGDMDTAGLFAASPSFGPVLFCLYVTVVVFVALTVTIALVCHSFSEVMHIRPEEGCVASFLAWWQGRKQARAKGETGEWDGEHPALELEQGSKSQLSQNPVYSAADTQGSPDGQQASHREIVQLKEGQEELQRTVKDQAREQQEMRGDLRRVEALLTELLSRQCAATSSLDS
eukprot:TRINITY_DN15021_c0_g1_i2.p1 TRINITY_DN15021_c0_g1~~TRINITY_DN15021_c0_g1_i2.p1  ORF type:complete len:265 (-),score=64.36 TRINITY_DN15021_c0_g1_i2:42-836(-)